MDRIQIGTVNNKLAAARVKLAAARMQKEGIDVLCRRIRVSQENGETAETALLAALENREIDVAALEYAAVYPLPADGGFTAAACLKREDVRSVLVTRRKDGRYLPNAVVEAAGDDEMCQLYDNYDGITCRKAQGGVNVQIGRLLHEQCDGILLPADAVKMLKCSRVKGLRYQYLDCGRFIPRLGQAATALVLCQDSPWIEKLLPIGDTKTTKAVEFEQALAEQLEVCMKNASSVQQGGENIICTHAQIERGKLTLYAYIRINKSSRRFIRRGRYEEAEQTIQQMTESVKEFVEYAG